MAWIDNLRTILASALLFAVLIAVTRMAVFTYVKRMDDSTDKARFIANLLSKVLMLALIPLWIMHVYSMISNR